MEHRSQNDSKVPSTKKLTFVRCKACRRVYRKRKSRELCPRCGAITEIESWPDLVGERLFNAVEGFFRKGDRELTIILACDFLEMMLEMFFTDLFIKQGRPLSWIQLTFRKNKSLDLRLRYLFKDALQVSFGSAIRGTPFVGFDRRWATIRSKKGTMYHARPPAVDENTAREAYDLLRDSVDFFAWLNNKYCV